MDVTNNDPISNIILNAKTTTLKKKNEYATDLKKLSKSQLLEILERQKRLVANTKGLSRLPDKGAKLISHLKEVQQELDRKESESDICDAFASLTLKQIDRLEWTHETKLKAEEPPSENYDEEDINPLKILATHSGSGFHKKEIKKEPEEKLLITERDIEDLYAVNLCTKLDQKTSEQTVKDKFRPYKTLNTAKQPSSKERDLCAAAEPLPKYGDVKLVGLEESLKLLMQQNDHLKEIQLAHAAERLKDKVHTIGEVLPSYESTRLYRETIKPEEEHEVRDDCEGHDGGDVRFPIDFDEVD